MVRIQLDDGYLEVKKGTNFPLNFGVADIRDLSKRSGTFSKTITLTGSDNNNQLLNHYYDVNIQAGTFDVNAKTVCAVIQNGEPIVEDAVLQLVSVDKVQNSDGHEEKVEYKVLVKDAQADFFTVLDNAELTDLDFSDLDHTYSAANVVSSFSNVYTDGYVYPLAYNPTNDYPLTEMLPAIYARQYFDRIHSTNGFSYTWDTSDDYKFDLAVVPYNGDKPKLDFSTYLVEAEKNSFTASLGSTITSWTENTDAEGLFNPTTGVYTPPFYIGTGQSINYSFDFDVDVQLVNSTGANAYLVSTIAAPSVTLVYRPRIDIYVNGSLTQSGFFDVNVLPAEWSDSDNPLANGTTTIKSLEGTVDVSINNLLPTDSVTFEIQFQNIGAPHDWQDAASGGSSVAEPTLQLSVTSLAMTSTLAANTLSFGQTINLNDFIPNKIKQKDFIKWILFRWNLYAEVDPDNPNNFIYKTRDDYYDEGATKDWTYKLAKDKQQTLQFLPELSNKKLLLRDKPDSDSYNEVYLDATNEVYGQVEYTFDNEYARGIDERETIFSPTPMVQTVFNAIVPSYVGSSPKTNIRLLLHNGTDTCEEFNIYNYSTTGSTALTSYPVVSHFDDNINPSFDLNFGTCDYYFYDGLTLTNNTMYNLFWRRTVAQINSGKMLVAYFDLNEGDIQTLSLSDKIRIDNSYWHINRVIDYDANGMKLTKVELLSVDTEIDLPAFSQRTQPDPVPTDWIDPSAPVAQTFFDNNNINQSGGGVVIKGVGNNVSPGLQGVVIGNNQRVTDSGVWVDGKNYTPPVTPYEPTLKTKVYPIGFWDMDGTAAVNVSHDLGSDFINVVSVEVRIFNDALTLNYNIENPGGANSGGYISYIDSTQIPLNRITTGFFDNTNFDDATINRGFVKVTYMD